MKRTWKDVDRIARDLVEVHPDVDPLALPLVRIRELVNGLPTFDDDPDAASDATLEEIQAAWYDELAS
jgi:FeS assembly protein IscX